MGPTLAGFMPGRDQVITFAPLNSENGTPDDLRWAHFRTRRPTGAAWSLSSVVIWPDHSLNLPSSVGLILCIPDRSHEIHT
jgi:hypothetical protein